MGMVRRILTLQTEIVKRLMAQMMHNVDDAIKSTKALMMIVFVLREEFTG
jgi:hypothetical protein